MQPDQRCIVERLGLPQGNDPLMDPLHIRWPRLFRLFVPVFWLLGRTLGIWVYQWVSRDGWRWYVCEGEDAQRNLHARRFLSLREAFRWVQYLRRNGRAPLRTWQASGMWFARGAGRIWTPPEAANDAR